MDKTVELLDVGGVVAIVVCANELWDEKADDPTTIDSTKSAAKETPQFCIIETIIVLCCVCVCVYIVVYLSIGCSRRELFSKSN